MKGEDRQVVPHSNRGRLWMDFVLLLTVVALAGYTFILGQKAKSAQRRAEQLADRLYSWGSETRTILDELRKQIRRLDFEIKRRAGEIEIGPDARVADLITLHPRMKDVLDGLQTGGCGSGSCSSTPAPETLAAAAATLGASVDDVLAEVQRFLADPDGYRPARTQSEGLIQVQIPERTPAN